MKATYCSTKMKNRYETDLLAKNNLSSLPYCSWRPSDTGQLYVGSSCQSSPAYWQRDQGITFPYVDKAKCATQT